MQNDVDDPCSVLRSLIRRVEGADGPDRALSGDLLEFFCKDLDGVRVMFREFSSLHGSTVPDLMGSLDAVTCFAANFLPGWIVGRLGQDPETGKWSCELVERFGQSKALSVDHDTAAMAVLLAALRAYLEILRSEVTE